jgi:UDP-N-acetylmuramoylalanine--D-glutamate ligase
MDLEDKKVLVVGLGRTGGALCDFLLNHGARVKISENKTLEEHSQAVMGWKKKGIQFEMGGHKKESFLKAELIVLSPGVPWLPELEAAQNQGIKIISEIELAYLFLRGHIVGITGTNGKSTTATLTHKILKDAGLPAFLAGNIGTPLISFVEHSRNDRIYVTEVSSFQLKHTEHFRASISVILNISPDHLDWHSSFDDYYRSKKNLLATQNENDTAVLNQDDPLIWTMKEEAKVQVYSFSRKTEVEKGCFIQGDWIVLKDKGEERLIKTSDIPLFGIHNLENVMAAALAGHILGVPLPGIRESVESFQGLEHRLEKITTIQGIDFYNDSKATNVDAALKSIQSFERKIVLILGGRDKGGDFKKLKGQVAEKVKHVLLIGEAQEKIKKALEGSVPMKSVSSLKEAVRAGYTQAEAGEVVLLAPACTSFDMFQNFEERGRIFKQEVLSLAKDLEQEKS